MAKLIMFLFTLLVLILTSSCEINFTNGASGKVATSDIGIDYNLKVGAGYNASCALIDGAVSCWGSNSRGELGDGTGGNGNQLDDSTVPVAVTGLSAGVTQLSVGEDLACALINSGIKCWGWNSAGQLGDGTSGNIRPTPVDVSGLSSGSGVTMVAAGGDHACAIVNGGVKCWGANGSGQIGDNTSGIERHDPVDVVGLGPGSGVVYISTNWDNSCAVLDTGVLKCWGDQNTRGDGLAGNALTPVTVSGISNAVQVDCGDGPACAVLSTGEVKCWGRNNNGELGNNDATHTTSLTPVTVVGISNATYVAVGYDHACAVLADGAMKCWGRNDTDGQLGNNDPGVSSDIPVDVQGISSGSGAIQVHAVADHTCVYFEDKTVKCWGRNLYGQVGSGTTGDTQVVPVLVF